MRLSSPPHWLLSLFTSTSQTYFMDLIWCCCHSYSSQCLLYESSFSQSKSGNVNSRCAALIQLQMHRFLLFTEGSIRLVSALTLTWNLLLTLQRTVNLSGNDSVNSCCFLSCFSFLGWRQSLLVLCAWFWYECSSCVCVFILWIC